MAANLKHHQNKVKITVSYKVDTGSIQKAFS